MNRSNPLLVDSDPYCHYIGLVREERYSEAEEFFWASGEMKHYQDRGFNPLHLAAHNGYTETCIYLIKNGYYANTKGANGFTPLHFAVSGRHAKLVKLLLEDYGADPNTQSDEGYAPLHTLAMLHYHTKEPSNSAAILELLLAHGAEINARDQRGRTAAFSAIACENVEALDALTEHGIDLLIKDNFGQTAEEFAFATGYAFSCQKYFESLSKAT